MNDVKKFRGIYDNKIKKKNVRITNKQYEEFEKNCIIEIKEKEGCRVEFLIHDSEIICAMMYEEAFEIVDYILDKTTYIYAYTNFNKFVAL